MARAEQRSFDSPDEVRELAPTMYVGPDTTYPIMGALYHPPGGIIRHDAVVWGLALFVLARLLLTRRIAVMAHARHRD